MALLHKKINDKYIDIDLYYRIEGIDFTARNKAIVFVNGYSNDEDMELLDQKVYPFDSNKEEPISYEIIYNLLKTLPEFEGAIDC